MEPDGWAVAGLPANFHADPRPVTVSGTLLDLPAEVRFTPTRFTWDYGDDTSRTTSTAGTSWQRLQQAEFTATPTSHTYRKPATVNVRLEIGYHVEYRLDGGRFVPIAGTLTRTAPPTTVTIVRADTVLVDRDCRRTPTGPGC
ncbi:hypothetical protein [Homoserinibacter sp. GY 40078]|uniref:hypothetical protein n=1 Tax=Homoserinibacter sp. GY 40078 TaxID=2603275 RepID=UPI0011C86202|nr:hypothetical protein [Homoserinibacter sp. GY 40078]TXK17134.1 hypothetical protein FVQ89_09700 [Homoserinibacter sp. GY 40078]